MIFCQNLLSQPLTRLLLRSLDQPPQSLRRRFLIHDSYFLIPLFSSFSEGPQLHNPPPPPSSPEKKAPLKFLLSESKLESLNSPPPNFYFKNWAWLNQIQKKKNLKP